MYRRVVLSTGGKITKQTNILYHVRGARLLSQHRISSQPYDDTLLAVNIVCAVVFTDSVRLQTIAHLGKSQMYEFILDVAENQPAGEAIEEIGETGVEITVFNENGAVVCHNGRISSVSNPSQTNAPGEMTSVPGEEPGEMAGETTGEPGATI